MANAVAENVLGTIGTVLWCIQLIPQVIRNYRAKNCEGLPLNDVLWAASGVPFYIFHCYRWIYPIKNPTPVIHFFCTLSWIQTLYYPPRKFQGQDWLHLLELLLPSQSVWKLGLSYG